MDIDFVIAWVDGSDPAWCAERVKYDPNAKDAKHLAERYRDWDNLQYWFRAVETYAPWVHKVYFVTWGHVPAWLNPDCEKLVIVNHKDFIPAEYLPTFNANTIELNFHRIPGLSEYFVFFNDDMFLTRPVKPEDFFRNGLPRDELIQDAVRFTPNSIGHLIGSDLALLNKHFDKKQLRRQPVTHLMNPGYGLLNLYRNLVLTIWPYYTGFYCSHICASYLKSTLEKVWELEPEVLHKTCLCRTRGASNVNQYLFKFWQLAEGRFAPRSVKFGRAFHLTDQFDEALADAIENSRYSTVCINDTELVSNFEAQKERVKALFQKKLPKKSSFEK